MLMDEEERNRRKPIEAPLRGNGEAEDAASGGIRIKAQPLEGLDQCKFMFDRKLLEEHSWVFPDRERTEGSPAASELFDLEGISSVQVVGSSLLLTREDPVYNPEDGEPIARTAGDILRRHLESGTPIVPPASLEGIPAEEEIASKVSAVIDEEINPGIAAHSGIISLQRVEGNRVFILMGGGCQGCSAASVTLKHGIHKAFRERIPGIGAIYDETDHAAGENPYFS